MKSFISMPIHLLVACIMALAMSNIASAMEPKGEDLLAHQALCHDIGDPGIAQGTDGIPTPTMAHINHYQSGAADMPTHPHSLSSAPEVSLTSTSIAVALLRLNPCAGPNCKLVQQE